MEGSGVEAFLGGARDELSQWLLLTEIMNYKNEQDRNCTYSVTLRRVRANTVAVEEQ